MHGLDPQLGLEKDDNVCFGISGPKTAIENGKPYPVVEGEILQFFAVRLVVQLRLLEEEGELDGLRDERSADGPAKPESPFTFSAKPQEIMYADSPEMAVRLAPD